MTLGKRILIAAALGVLLSPAVLYFLGVVFIVDQTEVGVVTQFGKVSRVIMQDDRRWGIQIPGVHVLYRFPAKLQSMDAEPEPIVTLDKKNLIVDNFFKWKIVDAEKFRNALGSVGVANRRLESVVHDALKDVLGNTDLADIIATRHEDVLEKSLVMTKGKGTALGIEIVDIHFQKVMLPKSTESRLYERMKSERFKEAAYYRSQGREESIRITSNTDRQVEIIKAEAYRKSQEIKGLADATAAEIYAKAFSRDPEFYSFWRTLQTYRNSLDSTTTLVISPKSELYKYFSTTR